ncbi:MAG: glycosyltransferase family 39 protein [Candidatus Micrarchaeota archaeon]|nr:glycosyltransferase family 39 protein [Candidatus Micrarchaeota archaeon]MDE1847618.1 glycosyltransferase family 39 protein [Candidatus Micrarchaeota archaeon]MDE1863821.1 glycosyltransferase family 39 protein [Candidatus Micrarchaeota archaeon]
MLFIGFIFTAALAITLASLIACTILARKDLLEILRQRVNKPTLAALVVMLTFFLVFSLEFVHPVEQLYFDENIYQGIALNILMHGNALWCQYGTGLLHSCLSNQLYHDTIGYPFLIAVAFRVFGAGISTAYGLQLFMGFLSILFFFLLASAIFSSKRAVFASTLSFTLAPQLFIWSRTQAIPDLALMCLACLTFFLFAVFIKRMNLRTFTLFGCSLALTVYMRIEGILLIPIFALLLLVYGEDGIRQTATKRFKLIADALNNNTGFLLVLLFLFLLIVPEIYYLSTQLANPSYGQDYSNQQLFSFSNFANNYQPNFLFLLGSYNSANQFPLVFPAETTILATIGAFLLATTRAKNKYGMLLLALAWIFSYLLFYDFFYAGAATFGVDDRFMLQLIPGLALLAGVCISQASEIAGGIVPKLRAARNMVCVALIILLLIVPFLLLSPSITLPPSKMPQQTTIYDALSFFYANYNKVPASCMVYSFTPDLWYEFNRSSAQIGYLGSTDSQFLNYTRGYGCRVVDFGYWCNVPPYINSTCGNILKEYTLYPLANYTNPQKGEHFALYQILNKTK